MLRDRPDQLLAMSWRDADPLEILFDKARQNLSVDTVLGEQLGILAEANIFEPLLKIAHCDKRNAATLR